jgi:hypothetical protein
MLKCKPIRFACAYQVAFFVEKVSVDPGHRLKHGLNELWCRSLDFCCKKGSLQVLRQVEIIVWTRLAVGDYAFIA